MKDKHNEAIEFLRKNEHTVGQARGGTVVDVDGKAYKITELHLLAEQLHPEQWRRIQRARDEEIRVRKA